MKESQFDIPTWYKWVAVVMAFISIVFLYVMSHHSYLLFYAFTELFSVIVSWAVGMLFWNSRRWVKNNYFLVLGVMLTSVASLDLLHMLVYQGVGFFADSGGMNLSAQIWIAARALQSLSMAIAPLLLPAAGTATLEGHDEKPARYHQTLEIRVVLCYILVMIVLVVSAFAGWLPRAYVEGLGMTPAKQASEIAISAIFLVSLGLLWRKRQHFERDTLNLLMGATALLVVSEMAFYFDPTVSHLSGVFGHYARLSAYFLIYWAVVHAGLQRPYELLFRDLAQQAEALHESQGVLQQQHEALRVAHAALESSRARYRDLYDRAPVGYLTIDEAGTITEANLTVTDMLGLDHASLVGRQLGDLVFDADRETFYEYQRQVIETDALPVFEVRFVRSNGSSYWARLVVTARYDGAGAPVYHVAIADITASKEAALLTERERSRLGQILDASPYGTYIASPDYQIEFVNAALQDMFGVPGTTRCHEYLYGLATPCPWCQKGLTSERQTVVREWHSPKTSRDYELYDVPLINDDGSISRLGVFYDVTLRRQTTDKLNEQLEELRRWHAVTLGREQRIIELKREVNELLARDNQPPYYLIDE